MAPAFAHELTVTLFFTHLDYLHPLYNRGALEQETSSHHTLTTMCRLFTKVERLIIWKIHINKAIQLPTLSDSEVFSVQSLRLSRQMYLFPPQVTLFRSDKAADLRSKPKPHFESLHFT